MCGICESTRAVYWSPLCETDLEAYKVYLREVKDGFKLVKFGCCLGARGDVWSWSGGRNDNKRIEFAGFECGGERKNTDVCGDSVADSFVDAQDNGHNGHNSKGVGNPCCGVSGDCSCGIVSGAVDIGVDSSLYVKGDGAVSDSESNAGAVPAVSIKTLQNRKRRAEKKERKKKNQALGRDWRVRSVVETEAAESLAKLRILENNKRIEKMSAGADVNSEDLLRESLRKKWQAQNELAAAEAERKLRLLSMVDIADEVKRESTALRASIERNMVSIEKTHATLVATGNVPNVFHGSAQTEVDSVPGLSDGVKSGTISPNSSVSEAEVRAMQQSILDMELKLARYRQITGLSWEAVEKADKKVWTDNTENHAVLEELYPMGYGIDTVGFPEGKFRAT